MPRSPQACTHDTETTHSIRPVFVACSPWLREGALTHAEPNTHGACGRGEGAGVSRHDCRGDRRYVVGVVGCVAQRHSEACIPVYQSPTDLHNLPF